MENNTAWLIMINQADDPHTAYFLTSIFEKARERPTVRGQGRSLLTRAPHVPFGILRCARRSMVYG